MTSVTSGKDAFDSISEGCFLVLPQARRNPTASQHASQKKRRTTRKAPVKATQHSKDTILSNDGFQRLFNGDESSVCMQMRHDFFKAEWNKVNAIINNVLIDTNGTTIDAIANFVDSSRQEESLIALPFHEIPTALVFAGINTPDHDAQFAQIVHRLRSKNNWVALLQSKDCGNIRNMMRIMIEQFLSGTLEREYEEEEQMEETYQLGGTAKISKAAKLPAYDLQVLEGWYRHAGRSKQPNLVVVLQDLETFESNVLQDFISICSEYRRRLPIVFVMGIATSSEILHQSLTKSSIGLLRVEKFWLEQSEVWFNRVLEKIFIDTPDTLKFGPRPYKFLLDHFYLYDFSMGKVTASLKYALMHHFYGNPLSIFLPLMGYSDATRVKKTLDEWYASGILSEHHATHIRMLSSFRIYVDSLADQDPHKALRLLDDDAYLFTEALSEFVDGLQRYQQEFRYGIELIRVLEGQFTSNVGLKKPKWKLLQMALESKDGLSNSEVILWPSSLVRKLDADKLGELVKQIQEVVEQFDGDVHGGGGGGGGEDGAEKANELVQGWIERLQVLQGGDKAYHAAMQKKAKKLAGMVMPDMDEPTLRRTETAKKVQNDSVDHLKQLGTDRTRIAIEVADWITRTLKLSLRSFTQVPLYELVYYTNVKLHEKSFSAQPRAAVQTGLGQAHHYLNCTCCNKREDNRAHILPSEPDTSILYKLYLECGRLINLYDWFVAFGCILEREKRTERLEEKEVQARFVRSVAELQFLGFIKPTQRKTDHVQRLTWSNA